MFKDDEMVSFGLCFMVSVVVFVIGMFLGIKIAEIKVNQYEILFKE